MRAYNASHFTVYIWTGSVAINSTVLTRPSAASAIATTLILTEITFVTTAKLLHFTRKTFQVIKNFIINYAFHTTFIIKTNLKLYFVLIIKLYLANHMCLYKICI